MYSLIVFFPIIGALLASGFGRYIGGIGAGYITIACLFATWIFSCIAFYEVAIQKTVTLIQLAPWIKTEVYTLYWGFLFDTLTCVMLIVVTTISLLVHIYSTEYMSQDPHLARFMSYLSYFTFFMLILVTADNFLQMFVGWEGVGLCSYLLINFWFGRIQANKSALKAMIINRIGDFGLALAIFAIYTLCHSLDYAVVFGIIANFAEHKIYFGDLTFNSLDLIGLCLFIGAVGKSAQIGLHTWLPDAMEGPTPVSALIHAATMVTAGVFLICRCSAILQFAPNISILITFLGGLTAFLAATTGLLQNDLKRVIAYSTCSQLGYMVFAAGLSSYSVTIFHLSNHAFFKALLFLGAGSVIHALSDEQDMRKMGGLVKVLPLTYTAMLVGSLALMGFPFLTGFYSKDVILEVAYGHFTIEGRFVHILGNLAAFFTAYYSTRLIALTFLRPVNGSKVAYAHVHEAPFKMALPLVVLSFASIFIGYLSRDMFIGMGTDFWGNALFTLPTIQPMLEAEWLESSTKLIPLIFSFSGVFFAFIHYIYTFDSLYYWKISFIGKYLYTFLNRKWFFDKVYNEWISQPTLQFAYVETYKNIDRGLLEFLGPNGISIQIYGGNISSNVKNSSVLNSISNIRGTISQISLGFIFGYLFIMFVTLFLILFVISIWSQIGLQISGVVFLLLLLTILILSIATK